MAAPSESGPGHGVAAVGGATTGGPEDLTSVSLPLSSRVYTGFGISIETRRPCVTAPFDLRCLVRPETLDLACTPPPPPAIEFWSAIQSTHRSLLLTFVTHHRELRSGS